MSQENFRILVGLWAKGLLAKFQQLEALACLMGVWAFYGERLRQFYVAANE